ncbi:MAG: hypothetical protein ACYTG0_04245 [Planctomycetota bacterium]|jgi:hypothetical protein
MPSPATAVLWEVWKRHRWVLIASSAWLIVVSGLCHALSDGVIFGVTLVVHEDAILMTLLLAIGPLLCGLLPLFAYGCDADIAGRESSFPPRMFTLPMTTRALVGWPMLYGTAAIALAWLAVASFVLRPGGMNVPLWWPSALLASCLAWVQALSWRPFGLPGLRIVAAVLSIGVLVAVSSLRWMAHLPEPVVSLLLGSTILPAYVVAVSGVARARRGDQPDWQWLFGWARHVADWFSLRGRFFGSPSRAQIWFEWRRCGLGLLIAVGLAILSLAILIIVSRHNPRLSPNSPLRSPILLLTVPLLAGVMAFGGWGNCGDPRRGQAIPAFLATRPMTCAGLIWAKMKAAAIGAAVVWGMALAAIVLMVLLTGSWGELAGQWNMLTRDFSAAEKAAMVTLGVVFLLAATWKPMVSNMFYSLTGRNWVYVVGAFVMGSVVVGIIPVASWLSMHPEYHDDLLAAVPWALTTAAVLKLLVGGWLVRVIIRRRLVETRLMARLVAAWLMIALCLTASIHCLVPGSLARWYLIAACVVLALPLVRLSLAPLALAWNRHR